MSNLETRDALKACWTFEAFDDIMNNTWCKSDKDKIDYLKQMFDVAIVHSTVKNTHDDYVAMAYAIMNYADD